MHCPNCGSNQLQSNESAPGLLTLKCGVCAGTWIQASHYWAWIEKNGGNLPEQPVDEKSLRMVESPKARICPECGCIMCRHEVGHGVGFTVDRCSACGGFWLDKGEFEALQRRNLHDDIHFVFSQAWQQQVQRNRQADLFEARMRAILGPDAYAEARRMKDWITAHPKRGALVAYLTGT